jgi:hypothetical protein
METFEMEKGSKENCQKLLIALILGNSAGFSFFPFTHAFLIFPSSSLQKDDFYEVAFLPESLYTL